VATYYVSQSTANGYAIGDDSRSTAQAVSKLTPWLTVDKAYTASAAGDTIVLNDGTYTHATLLTVAKSLTINPETPYGAILRSVNATRVIHLNSTSGAISLTLGQVVVDANNTSASGITFNAAANLYTLALNGTKFLNPTLIGVNVSTSAPAVALTARNIIISGTAITQSGIYASGLGVGSSVDIDGITVDMSGQTTNEHGAVVLKAVAEGVTATVKNVTGSIVVNASANQHLGVRIFNIPAAVIEYCNINISGGTGTASGILYWIGSDMTTPLTSANGIIRYNRGQNSMPGGILALIGQDASAVVGTAKNYSNGGKIYGNNCSGTAANRASLHGFMLGNSTGGEAYGNFADSVAFLVIAKGQDGGVLSYNSGTNIAGIGGLRAKASTGSKFYNNTVQCISGWPFYADHDATTSIYSADVEFKNNIAYVTDTVTGMVRVSVGSTGTFANNVYYSTVALPVNPWVYQLTNYATFEDWQTAQELTAVYADPQILSNGKLRANSPCRNAGVDVGLTADFAGRPVRGLPDLGAYEYRRPARRGFGFGF